MITYLRQSIFLLCAIILRWPLCVLINIVGRTGIFKTVFLVYPTDELEVLGFCPNIPFFRRYLSGKPTPAGLIMDGWLPLGIYFVISDAPRDLAFKKNRHVAESIVQQMHWYRKLTGARTIGLAGQLGPIFTRHNIKMEPPIYTSIYGNIFSIYESINWIAKQKDHSFLQKEKIAVIGGGKLGGNLQKYLHSKGYDCLVVNVRYTVRLAVLPLQTEDTKEYLSDCDYVINIMPKGKDFIDSGVAKITANNAIIIDFSRPGIPGDQLTQKVYMGNRVQRSDMLFIPALPGGWTQKQLPACALPALIASFGNYSSGGNMEEFHLLAKYMEFKTNLME